MPQVGKCCSPYANNGPTLYGGDPNLGGDGCPCSEDDLMDGNCSAGQQSYNTGCMGTGEWDLIWSNQLQWDWDYRQFDYHGHADELWMNPGEGNFSQWGLNDDMTLIMWGFCTFIPDDTDQHRWFVRHDDGFRHWLSEYGEDMESLYDSWSYGDVDSGYYDIDLVKGRRYKQRVK